MSQTKTQWFQANFDVISQKDAKQSPVFEGGEIEGTVIRGFASTPTLDRDNDVVEPEAFRKSIAVNYRKNPIILFQHNQNRPIGKATFMSLDGQGLYIEALIVDKEIEPKIKAGILRTFSIGYIPKTIEFRDENNQLINTNTEQGRVRALTDPKVKRVIKELDLVENSVVSVPANPDAVFTLKKSIKSFFDSEMDRLSALSNNPDLMNAKKENLLEVKEEEVEETQEVEETVEPAAEAEATEEEATEASEPVGDEKSADVEGDETDAVEEEVVESEEAEVEEAEVTEEPETEEAPAEEPAEVEAEEGEKSVTLDAKQSEMAIKAIADLKAQVDQKEAEIAELQKQLAETPAKEAMIYAEEHTKFKQQKATSETTEGEAPVEEEECKGFKDTLITNAF